MLPVSIATEVVETGLAKPARDQKSRPSLKRFCRFYSNCIDHRSRQTQFTALLHHVDIEALARAFKRLCRRAAPEVDGMTVSTYEASLEGNLRALHDRRHRRLYRPMPARRTYIPKADGGKRPLGILALEDKIVKARWWRC
jgi:RNA-directed DNA polymerase